MNIFVFCATMLQILFSIILNPTMMLKQEQTLIGGDKTCEITFVNNTNATMTIEWKAGEIINLNQLTLKSRNCKDTGLKPVQLQWKWVWQGDDKWKAEEESIYNL